MEKLECLYCGSHDITTTYPEQPHEHEFFTCQHCQLCFSDLERRFSLYYQPPKDKLLSEEEALNNAWALMQKKQWNSALILLFQDSFPDQHPLELMVYRNVCFLGSLFALNCILQYGPNYDLKYLSNFFLEDILLHNIENLQHYLPHNDEDKLFGVMQRLFQALDLLGKTNKIFAYESSNNSSYQFNQEKDNGLKTLLVVVQKRIDVLSALAKLLEDTALTANSHQIDYLKMAFQLQYICLRDSDETKYKTTSELAFEKALYAPKIQLPQEIIQQIEHKIAILTKKINEYDPHFKFQLVPPKQQLSYVSSFLRVLLYSTAIGTALFLFLAFLFFTDIGEVVGKYLIKLMDLFVVVSTAGSALVIVFIVLSFFFLILSPKQLYKRLYPESSEPSD